MDLKTLLKSLENPLLRKIEPGLERIQAFCHHIGNPHHGLRGVIHVAGTNGKGSLCAYLTAVFKQSGFSVNRYTSPHLVRFNERIMIDHRDISDNELMAYLLDIKQKTHAFPMTFFESTTAVAFQAFARHPADYNILEVGMGGRMDATNIIDSPALSVLTPVSMDHMEYLGDTLEQICFEKACIMKTGTPCVVGPQKDKALRVIRKVAEEKNIELFVHGCDWDINIHAESFDYISSSMRHEFALPNLNGVHQIYNAATAIACIEKLQDERISLSAIHQGITQAHWPARLQRLSFGPMVDVLPSGSQLWLDGAHNLDGARMLAQWIEQQHFPCPVYLICGMLAHKVSEEFIATLKPQIAALFAVPVEGGEGAAPGQLENLAKKIGVHAYVAAHPLDAIKAINLSISGSYIAIIGGSLYLAGDVLVDHS